MKISNIIYLSLFILATNYANQPHRMQDELNLNQVRLSIGKLNERISACIALLESDRASNRMAIRNCERKIEMYELLLAQEFQLEENLMPQE